MNASSQSLTEPGNFAERAHAGLFQRGDARTSHPRTGGGQAERLAQIGVRAVEVAHDFNSILSSILGYSEHALSKTRRGSRVRRDIEGIVAASARGRSLIEQVLTHGRTEVPERNTADVEAAVREALDLLAPALPGGITIEMQLEARGARAYVRPIDLHRLLMNLATNAIRAMSDGGTLRVSLATERVATARAATMGSVARGEYIVLRVADSGVGIEPLLVPRIFDRFFTTRKAQGIGLGLSLVRDVALQAGGAIDVDSRVGAGSRFTVHLPRARAGLGERVDFDYEEAKP
jgi:signal transduction histidine kinase